MTKREKRERIAEVIERLRSVYPEALCALEYGGDPWRLLVMARLSAQCTDERVNIVCRDLFREIPDAQAMADAPLAQIEELIRPCGLFRTKANDIKNSSIMLLEQYGGVVPDSMDELLKLPGIGRKTANLILGDIYKTPGSVVADTHCIRIAGRLGFTDGTKDPAKVEEQLRKKK